MPALKNGGIGNQGDNMSDIIIIGLKEKEYTKWNEIVEKSRHSKYFIILIG